MSAHTACGPRGRAFSTGSSIKDRLARRRWGDLRPQGVSVMQEKGQGQSSDQALITPRHRSSPTIVLAETYQAMAKPVGIPRNTVVERRDRLTAGNQRQAGVLHSDHREDPAQRRLWMCDEVLIAHSHVAIGRATEDKAARQIP